MSVAAISARRAAAPLLALVLAAALLALGARAQADDPAPVAITAAPALDWGFKISWRGYAPKPETSDGARAVASTVAPYDLEWDFESGSYDPATRTTRLDYAGTVHWQKYRASQLGRTKPPTYTGSETDPYLLDVMLGDPRITISRDSALLTAIATSRNQFTWELTSYGRVPIVNLDVTGVTPAVAGGTTAWAGIPATVATEGNAVFDGNYRAGQVVDELGFSYSGPGGAPDFSEHWDQPGMPVLKLVQNTMFVDGEDPVIVTPLWIDQGNMIVHSLESVDVGGQPHSRISAFDLERMQPVGTPLVLPAAETPTVGAFDLNQGRILYRAGTTGWSRWMKFNAASGEYERGVLGDPKMAENAFAGTGVQGLAWDPGRDRGYRVQRLVPEGVGKNEWDKHEWTLLSFHEGDDGVWERKAFELPSFPAGQNQLGYSNASSPELPTYATASDGSLIVLATVRSGLATSAMMPGAYRIAFDQADAAVDVQPLPVEVTNSVLDGGVFGSVQTGPGGQILLLRDSDFVQLKIGADGTVTASPPVSVEDAVEPPPYDDSWFALDPADGIVWFGGKTSQQLAAFRDGAFLGGQLFKERNPRGGPVLVGDGHYVYAQTNDGDPGSGTGTASWGYGKFERLGFVPTVTAQPQADAVALGSGEASAEATFGSTASADPAPQRQWQVKAPGANRFIDLVGKTGTTLSVAATRADDGAEYRAVYSNAAGRVASEAAALSVDYAPIVLQSPANAQALEGGDAEFAVLADGKPEPTVTWQRRVGGIWTNIGDEDESVVADANKLTVHGVNPEQSGARFRARLTNSLGQVSSAEARLTVTPKVTIPPGGAEVERATLEWSGSAELQKAPPFGGSNYFSAGVSHGDEASFKGREGNAFAFQVGAGGGEAVSTWATRADHIGPGSQLIRLYRGTGTVAEDGSATVAWHGSFSVNFYGGLAPFTLGDPVLTVDGNGQGELRADLVGCASSQANPAVCTPLPSAADVTVATFSGVEVDPAGDLTVTPDYAGVEVEVPAPPPQSRTAPGWGAWPQPFVDYHVQTGLAPYWYSSGGSADPDKPPAPFTVDFTGEEPPLVDPAGPGGGGKPAPPAPPAPVPPSVSAAKSVQAVGPKRRARVATLRCPGASPCVVKAPRNAPVRIGGRTYWATVFAPKTIPAGASATVRARLGATALAALGERRPTLRVRLQVRSDEGLARLLAQVRLEAG